MLRKFIDINWAISMKIEPYLPLAREAIETDMWGLYDAIVAKHMNSKPGQVIADVGGGNSCLFAKEKKSDSGTRIIAVDISEGAMKDNHDVDEKRVEDITKRLPFNDGEVDILVSKSVLEHLRDLEGFIVNSKNALKNDGSFIHLFPAKFAPFAVINQLLPKKLSRKILHFLMPESKGIGGFPAYYNKCYYSAFKPLLEKHGFEILELRLRYYQSRYFSFFVPLFLLSALYEMFAHASGIKNLSAFILVVARRKQ